MLSTNDLKDKRKSIFEKCKNCSSPLELLLVQEDIYNNILDSENRIKSNSKQKKYYKFNIEKLRLFCDGLAWSVIHPHAIRQLAKSTSKPPSLNDQKHFFHRIFKYSFDYLKKHDVPIMLADLTNIIKTGDLILCSDPEYPTIVEYKNKLPSPEKFLLGRIGRQVSKGITTSKYLKNNEAKIFGDPKLNLCIPTLHKAERNWERVTIVCEAAMKSKKGVHFEKLSDYEIIGAHIDGKEAEVSDLINNFFQQSGLSTSRIYLGTSSGLMNMFDGLFPSPLVWPIPQKFSFCILEDEITVVHAITSQAFEYVSEDGYQLKILPQNDFPIIVSKNGKDYPFSLRFIYDVLYGFETVESCIKGLIDFAEEIQRQNIDIEAPKKLNKLRVTKPSILYLDSIEDVRTLQNNEKNENYTYVSISRDLYKKIAETYDNLSIENMRLISPKVDSSYYLFDFYSFMELIKLNDFTD